MITASVGLLVGLMVAWWSTQGIFSSLIHLVLTVLAGCVALAVWEPVVYGFLLDRMPEYAWGVGLVVPFGLSLLIFRIAFDHLIPGNLSFHNIADRVGGGFFGFLSGVLTAGLLVIGLQMCGLKSFFGYNGWDLGGNDQPQKVASITPSVDTLAAGFFDKLSTGSMSPIGSNATLAAYHPDLAAEANLFTQAAFLDSRRATVVGSIQLGSINPQTTKIELSTYCIVNQVPVTLVDEKVELQPNQKLVVIPVTIAVQPVGDIAGAGDEDGILRITRSQIALATSTDSSPRSVQLSYPIGYVQLGQYGALGVPGEYAYSRSGVAETTHHWVFKVPADQQPLYIRIKGARIDLRPLADKAVKDVDVVAGLVTYKPTTVTLNPDKPDGTVPGDPTGGPTRAIGESIRVSDALPWTLSRNQLGNLTVVGDAIASGNGRLRKPGPERIGPTLAVKRIHHAAGARIVQVDLGTRDPKSLLGQIRAFAATVTQPPILRDSTGAAFFAIGYSILRDGEFEIAVDPANAIRSVRQIDMGSLSDTDRVVLYYQIPENTKLTSFDLGNAQHQEIDVEVK